MRTRVQCTVALPCCFCGGGGGSAGHHQRRTFVCGTSRLLRRVSSGAAADFAADPAHLFAEAFGAPRPTTAAKATVTSSETFSNTPLEVETLFTQQFGAGAAGVYVARQPEHSQQHHIKPYPNTAGRCGSHGITGSAPSIAPAADAGAEGPWSGLRAALRNAGHTTHAAAAAVHRDHNDACTWSASFPANTVAAAAPSASATRGVHGSTAATPSHPAPLPASPPTGALAPTAATQRYWYSYRLWQAVHARVQQEGGILESFRSQAHRMKATQRAHFQTQLRGTTRWTLFVVLPLLTALWAMIFFDSMLYRAEVMALQFVNYEEALRDFNEAHLKDQASKTWRGRGATKSKKTKIPFD